MRTASAAPRHWSQIDPVLGDAIRTLDLVLASEGIARGTRRIYCEATTWMIQRLGRPVTGWDQVTVNDVRAHVAGLIDAGYSTSYISNQVRALKAAYQRLAREEGIPDVMRDITGPTPVAKLVPVLEDGELPRLLAACDQGKSARWEKLRDRAMVQVLASSGCRLAELAGMTIPDVDLDKGIARVVGKGSKPRFVRFDKTASLAIARYLRARRAAMLPESDSMWIGRKGPLTVSGCYQSFKRRARMAGLPSLHPHAMRHDFSHRFLFAGGEGADLMVLNGWSSPSMLSRYGASAASRRASAAYDRVFQP